MFCARPTNNEVMLILPYVQHMCFCMIKVLSLAFKFKFCSSCICYVHKAVLMLLTVLKKESMVTHENCTCTYEFCAEGFC